MKNWSIDEQKFKQLSPEDYEIWKMSQMINFGCDGEKISYKRMVVLLPKLDIDDEMRTLLTWYIDEQNKSSVTD
jgi:hypothetical protein